MKLLVVIVNYRSAPLTVDCLRSLAPEVAALPGTRVVVVEGASGDGSDAVIANAIANNGWESWATQLVATDNRGFAYGNNLALRPAMASNNPPDYVLLLNPDTVVCAAAVRELLAFMESHPTVGIAGSRLEQTSGVPYTSAFRFPSMWSELDDGLRLGVVTRMLHKRVVAPPVLAVPHATDWVAGASMMIRRDVITAIGLMDERYFLYFEETDYCLRARNAGWDIWYVPQSRVVHLLGQSTGVTNIFEKPRRRPRYWFNSRKRYFVTHRGRAYAFAADVCWLVGLTLHRARALLQRKPTTDPPHLIQDHIRHSLLTWRLS